MTNLAEIKILIGPSSFAELDKTPLKMLESHGVQVIDNPYKRKLTKTELLELLADDVEGIIAGLEPLDREVFQKTKLKVISRVGSGLSNVDLEAAEEHGIIVKYTPYGPTSAVVELTIGIMLNMLRMVPQMDRDLHEKKWAKRIGAQLEGKTVVVIGFGRIGRRVAETLSAFNAKIIGVDPYFSVDEKFDIQPLESSLPQADIITIHSSGEQPILGDEEFSKLKKGVYLLNAARGGIISEASLIKALDDEVVAGAWLDTFEQEPYNGPLTEYEQVVLTPHIGSYTAECRKKMETEAVENLLSAMAGKVK